MTMTMQPLRAVLSLLLAFAAAPAFAADSKLSANCDLQEIGVKDKTEFLRFDHDLRYALERGDAAALSLLVQFPLAVNFEDDSHISLSDAGTLQKQFDRVFTHELRAAVKKQSLDNLICKYTDGVGYDNGDLWVNLGGAGKKQFRVIAVNVPGAVVMSEKKAGEIDLACSTKQFRIVIDFTGNDSKVRYRVWNLPHGVHEKPDLELTGMRDIEGTSPCTHRIWEFHNANAVYALSEPGCGPDSPPAGAIAQLQVSVDGAQKLDAWCF